MGRASRECCLDLNISHPQDLLHTLSKNLLAPCAYPVPFPAREHIHQPIPPLASHQPPHGIYNFCASLRDIVLAIEPGGVPEGGAEKWALMFKGPVAKGERAPIMGEWWTSVVDHRAGRDVLAKVKGEKEDDRGLLEILAEDGDKFGEFSARVLAS